MRVFRRTGKQRMNVRKLLYRFGHGARLQYGDEYPEWDQELEVRLQADWHAIDEARNWNEDQEAVHFGWDY